MKIQPIKTPKKIWFNGELWSVHSLISPTARDNFLILYRYFDHQIHEDGSTPVDMIMIDVHNDTFYPDTPKVREIMQRRLERNLEKQAEEDFLDKEWIKVCEAMPSGYTLRFEQDK